MADKHDTLGHQQDCPSPTKASLPEHYLIFKEEFTSDGWQTGKSLNPSHSFHDCEGLNQCKNEQFSKETIKACVNVLTTQ